MFCNVTSKSSNDLMLIITTLDNHTAAMCHPISKICSGVEAITQPLVDTAIFNTAFNVSYVTHMPNLKVLRKYFK